MDAAVDTGNTGDTKEPPGEHSAPRGYEETGVAGPFGDNGVLRGIFVFRVDSLDEARQLSETDPAVQAGRLALDIHPWSVPEGILP